MESIYLTFLRMQVGSCSVSYKDRVTNEEVRAKIQQATGPHEDLLTSVNRRKLQ